MRIITLNVNGIRAANRKGFFAWLGKQNADVVCLQEIKAQVEQLTDPIYFPEDYHCYYYPAQRKGYSGVALFSRVKPKKITQGLGWDHADLEGRYIEAEFDNVRVASLYLPSGSSSEERQINKYDFMQRYQAHLNKCRKKRKPYIICGDWNIAHKEIDLKNWRANRKNSGFLPQERAWLDQLFDEMGFVDAFRLINQEAEQYTWWSNRGQAWAKNVGWRLDYQVISSQLVEAVREVSIYKDERFSDHAPVCIDYKLI